MSETTETTIAKGTYTIENTHRRNDIFLVNGTLVAGSSEADADPPLEACWTVTPLKNGRYIMSPAAQRNLYASWPADFGLGSEIMASPTPHHWVVREARVKETFVISPGRHHLYWGIEDDDEGTAVTLRYPPTGPGNQWRFCQCLTSTTAMPQNVILPRITDENKYCETETVLTRTQTIEVDDVQPTGSTPVVPQGVVGSPTIQGSKADAQTATTPIPNQRRKVDDVPARSTCAVPQNLIESPKSVVESRTVVDGHTTSTPSETRSAKDDRLAIRHILEGHASYVFSVAYSPDGKQIVSGSGDKTVCVWDVPTRCLALKPMEGHTRWVLSVAFSPDGKRIISGSIDPTVRIWDAQSGTLARTLNHPGWVRSVACSSDGKRVVSGCHDRAVRVWDVETGSLVLGPLLGHTGWVYTVKFSPDGKQFLSGSYDNTVRVWDADTGHAIRTFRSESSIRSAMFSPDSKQIVSGDESYMVTVWDMQSGDSITLQGHQGTVFSVGFSPDGERIVSGGSGGLIIVWDAKFGKALGRLEGHTDIVTSVAFSPDGKWIVSGSQDNTVRIWEADRLDAMPDVE